MVKKRKYNFYNAQYICIKSFKHEFATYNVNESYTLSSSTYKIRVIDKFDCICDFITFDEFEKHFMSNVQYTKLKLDKLLENEI